MTGARDRDLSARLTELEATVRGLTQELVSAEERLRQLERAVEEGDAGGATKDTPEDPEPAAESTSEEEAEPTNDLDDIIVA